MDTAQIGIRLDNVSKSFGKVCALDGISIQFRPGILHGMIGPEGAGKTTLLRIILSLLKAQKGRVVYHGQSGELPLSEIRGRMAYMPQRQSLYADLSVSEHLDFFRDLYQISETEYREKRQELLHITRLEAFQNRAAGNLSGGMYKKLGLMCALLQSPNMVFLDEPTNGVDPISRREFWDLLYRLAQKKIFVLIATAYMDEAERCAEVHLIHQGKCIAEGEPRLLLEREGVSSFDALFIEKSQGGRFAS